MACCGGEEEQKSEGVVVQRRCRDVLCLLFFLAFWAGMFVVCGMAVRQGDANRLVYGVDSFGFTCGTKNSYNGTELDLRGQKNLYYLNPLDLLSVSNIKYAKTVCVDGCPSSEDLCSLENVPCSNTTQFYCPYYRVAPSDLYNKLPIGVPMESVQWFDALGNMSAVVDPNATATINKLQSLNLQWINDYFSRHRINSSGGAVNGHYYQLTSQMPNQGPCYPVWVETTDYFHRCFPKIPSNWTESVVAGSGVAAKFISSDSTAAFKDSFNSLAQRWSRYVGDISKGILIIIVAGLVGGVVISLIWMIILRYFAGLMAWLTILLVNVALIGLTLYCFNMAGILGSGTLGQKISESMPEIIDPSALEREQWKWIAIGSAVFAGIILLVTLLMISRVRVAVACIKVASQAVGAMPSIIFFPILPFIFEVGLLIYWIAITALLYSAGDLVANCRNPDSYQPFNFKNYSSWSSTPTYTASNATATCYTNVTSDERSFACGQDPNCYLSYDWNNKLKYAFIYHFFGLLWTNQFIVGFSCVTIAGAIASYYWARGDPSKMATFPVLAALKNTVIYHLGSIAFGAFIIAVIQMIRVMLEYLDKKTKELQATNKFAEWAMCCVKCCMWCLEKIVSFINRNAYIMVAVKGTNYCVSAGRAVALIVQNALRLIAVNFIGDMLLFLGKVAVAAGCGMIAFAMAGIPYYTDQTKYPDTYLSSPILPIALSIITAFIIAEIFFAVYEMAIDTIILAFCEDCEVNNQQPKYAPPLLMEAIGQSSAAQTAQPIKA